MIPRSIFNSDHEAFRDMVVKFLEKEAVPFHAQWEEDGQIDRALWNKAGEQGPFILVGHSMAGLYIPIYAKRWPDQVAGLVFVDTTTPQATKERAMSGFATRFAQASKWAAIGASMGLFKPVTGKYGDRIGLPPAAKAEKKHAFASGAHNRNAYDEVKVWNLSGQQLIDAGPDRKSVV